MPAGEAGEHFAESGGYAGSAGGGFNQGGGGFQGGGGLDQGYPGYGIYGSAGQQPGWNMPGSGTVGRGNNAGINTGYRPGVTPQRRVVYNPTTQTYQYAPYMPTYPNTPVWQNNYIRSYYDPFPEAPDYTGGTGYPLGWGGWGSISGTGGTADSAFEKYQDRISPSNPGYGDPLGGFGNPSKDPSQIGGASASMAPMNMTTALSTLAGPGGGPQVNPGPINDWRQQIMAWRAQRPDRPDFQGMDDAARLAAKTDWRSAIDAWRAQRPTQTPPIINPIQTPRPSRRAQPLGQRPNPNWRPMPPTRQATPPLPSTFPIAPINRGMSEPVVRRMDPNLRRRNAVA